MRDIAKAVERYIDQNLELKNISYTPNGDGTYSIKPTTGKERLTKTSKVIAEEIVDLVFKKLEG